MDEAEGDGREQWCVPNSDDGSKDQVCILQEEIRSSCNPFSVRIALRSCLEELANIDGFFLGEFLLLETLM